MTAAVRRTGRALRAAACAAVALAARTAAAGESAGRDAILAARDEVFARPEFRYEDAAPEDSFLRRLLALWQEIVQRFHDEHPVLFLLAMAGLGLVLAVLVAHLAWTWRTARRARYDRDDPRDLEAALRRLDPAPFRRRADEHARAGRFDEAVRDLYTALLLTLDRRGSLRYAGHKAFLDYRIETSRDDDARAALDLFEDAYPPGSFGRRPPRPERFASLAAAVDDLGAAPRRAETAP